MMQISPVLCLKRPQVQQLTAHLAAYRSYLWRAIMPTPERNQTIRFIQSMQGRLEQAQKQGQTQEIFLSLSAEERRALQQLLSELLQLYGSTPPCEQRTQTLGEVAGLRVLVERALYQA